MDSGTPVPDELLDRLRTVLTALASSSERQPALFPDLVSTEEKLASEYDVLYAALAAREAVSGVLPLLSEISALFERRLDAREHVFSAGGKAPDADSSRIRDLASRALEQLGWSAQPAQDVPESS